MSRIHYIALACLGINLAAAPLTAQSDHPLPNTARKPVTDTYHGVAVAEDYRWLENWDDPAVRAWSDSENAHWPALRRRLW